MGHYLSNSVYSQNLAPWLPFIYFFEDAHAWKKVFNAERGEGEVNQYVKESERDFLEAGIKKLIPRNTTCIEKDGNYVAK